MKLLSVSVPCYNEEETIDLQKVKECPIYLAKENTLKS